MKAATTCPTPGIMPIPVPMNVDRIIVRIQLLNSANVRRSPVIRRLLDSIKWAARRSMPIKISGSANTPISIGSNGIPDSMFIMPNENRDNAPIGSCPIMPKNSPRASISNPLTNTPLDVAEITISARNRMAASSGGPMKSATAAIGPINAMVIMSLVKSPLTEE